MDKLPKISVITPSYNQGQFLEQTILSVIGQRYPNLEYIIMDGGSSDNSVDIIKNYEQYLSHWVSKKDDGQSAAINEGFSLATGDILFWLNSDDMLMPGALFVMAENIKMSGMNIYFGNCLHILESNGAIKAWGSDVRNNFLKWPLTLFDSIIQPSSFWSREVWLKVGKLREDLHFGFDWEWFLRAQKLQIGFTPIDNCISMYRIHDQHKSGIGGKKRQKELLQIYNEYSTHYSELYDKICNEDINRVDLLPKILSRFLNIVSRDNSFGEILKILKKKKYKKYKCQDIDIIIEMI